MPLQARVTLEMVHFDGRAVGGAPEGCARCLMCRCEHILNAKSSRDAFVAQWHEGEGHYCGCVMCTGGPLMARVSLKMVHLVGGQSVARPALFLFTVRHYEHLMTATRSRDAFLGVIKSQVQSFSAVVCMSRPLQAHV